MAASASASSSSGVLSSLVRESKARRAELVADNAHRKQEAVAAVSAATGASMDAINGGAATVWHNQQQLEAEARLLHQQAQRLTKQSAQWVQSYQGFHQALKALGDVENWARAIESDMAFIHTSLDELHSRQPPPDAPQRDSSAAQPID